MNSEPVAWMVEDDEDRYFLVNGKGLAKPDDSWKSVIPLYTHPVKELTDEEITAISKEIFKDYKNYHYYQIDFARAILRKAQEK